MKFHHLIAASAVMLAAVAFSGSASAAKVFDNGPPSLPIFGIISGNAVDDGVTADNFALANPTKLTGAHFWTIEAVDPILDISNWDGTLKWYIFADNGGKPAASPLASGSDNEISKGDLGPITPGEPEDGHQFEYNFTFDKPIDLAAGIQYWFGLHLASNFDFDGIFWEGTGDPAAVGDSKFAPDGDFNDWRGDEGEEHAFFLNGDEIAAVPEPGTLALLGAGLFGLYGFVRRRNA